jgi:hypothetical protein
MMSAQVDLSFRVLRLLELADGTEQYSKGAEQMELDIIGRAIFLTFADANDPTSGKPDPRQAALITRQALLAERRRARVGDSAEDIHMEALTKAMGKFAQAGLLDGRMNGRRPTSESLQALNDGTVEAVQTCARAASLATDEGDVRIARVFKFNALHFMSMCFDMGSKDFMEAGLFHQYIGGIGSFLEIVRNYDHSRDDEKYSAALKYNTMLAGVVATTTTALGYYPATVEYTDMLGRFWQDFHEGGDSNACPVAGELYTVILTIATMIRVNFKGVRIFANAAKINQWNSPMIEQIWDGFMCNFAQAFAGPDNGIAYLRTLWNLVVFLIDPEAVSRNAVQSMLEDKDTLCELSDIFFEAVYNDTGLLELAALAAERIGDDNLAEFYAAKGAELYAFPRKRGSQASLNAIRGRVAARAGQRESAVVLFQEAVREVIVARQPGWALRWAMDCGGSEGDVLVNEISSAMARSTEKLLREFNDFSMPWPNAMEASGEPDQSDLPKMTFTRQAVLGRQESLESLDSRGDIKVVVLDPRKQKHVFVSPAAHPLALETVKILASAREDISARGSLAEPEAVELRRLLDEEVKQFLLMYTMKLQHDQDTVVQMKDIANRTCGRFRNTYLDAMQRSKEDDPCGEGAFISMATSLRQQVRAVRGKMHTPTQGTGDLVELFHQALKPHALLHTFCTEVVAQSGGALVRPDGVALKHIWRAMEKITFKPDDEAKGEANKLMDVARNALEFRDYGSMERALLRICTSDAVEVVRIKDRISTVEKATPLGWSDIMINLYFKEDAQRHIVEVQLFHELSMKCRGALGGHTEYAQYRTIVELFAVNSIQFESESPGSP